MSQDISTNERIYGKLKAEVLIGAFSPHTRLDFAELAEVYDVSTTPVREAAMRLLGEGLLEPHPKGGARPLLASEVRLRALLDLHARLVAVAVDWAEPPFGLSAGTEAATSTEQLFRILFRSLAKATRNAEFVELFEHVSDRLAPYRSHEDRLIDDIRNEITALLDCDDDPAQFRKRVRGYHRRRIALVPQLVWLVNSTEGRG